MKIKQKITTWVTIGLVGLISVFSSGCTAEQWEAHKSRVRAKNQAYYNKILTKIVQDDNEKFGRAQTINEYQDGDMFYFSKSGYPCRYALKLDTLQGYRLCPGEKEWTYNEAVTQQSNKNGMFTIASQAKPNQNNNQADRDARVIDGATAGFGANMATQGILNAIGKYRK